MNTFISCCSMSLFTNEIVHLTIPRILSAFRRVALVFVRCLYSLCAVSCLCGAWSGVCAVSVVFVWCLSVIHQAAHLSVSPFVVCRCLCSVCAAQTPLKHHTNTAHTPHIPNRLQADFKQPSSSLNTDNAQALHKHHAGTAQTLHQNTTFIHCTSTV